MWTAAWMMLSAAGGDARKPACRRTSGCFAIATIDASGTVRLRLVSQEGLSLRTHECLTFETSHPEYARVLDDVGPLRTGEEKIVRPNNEEPS